MNAYDAVVVGGGHHGLVAAIELADHGRQVLLCESRPEVGGAVADRTIGDFVVDEFSAFHPLAAASPVIQGLGLDKHGLQWARSERVVAHLGRPDDTSGALLHADPAHTAARLDADAPGDGAAWLELVDSFASLKDPLLDALLLSWPPVRHAPKLAKAVGATNLLDFVRFALLPVEQLSVERFRGRAARDLLSGNAMHADIPPEAPGSGVYGWIMTMLAQDVGFPTPVGGAGALARSLRSRAEAAGVEIRTGTPVVRIRAEHARASGVDLASGEFIKAPVVIADTSAPMLYGTLLEDVPAGLRARMERFTWDLPTIKINLGLSGAMPWTAEAGRSTSVVHVGGSHRDLVRWSADLGSGRIPEHPFALVGQMTSTDPLRSPAGTESMWVYSHLPRGVTDDDGTEHLIRNCERMLEEFAPGWRDLVVERWDQTPRSLQDSNANLGEGAVGGGTMQLFQQAFWRPATGLGGPRTFLPGLYLGSAAIHPGGGVHGGAGHMAARAALADSGLAGKVRDALERRVRRSIDTSLPRF